MRTLVFRYEYNWNDLGIFYSHKIQEHVDELIREKLL